MENGVKNKIFLYALFLILGLIIAVYFALYNDSGYDFPVFYRAACIILDPNTPNALIYSFPENDNYPIPEVSDSISYVYSMAAAYMLAPLALMPYYWAKTALIFIDIIAYLAAATLILRNLGATGRYIFYPLIFSLLWLPFLQDLNFGQLNAILFLLVTLAVLSAAKNNTILAGVLLGIAALFKLFPIAIAMVLGLKNWRVMAACAAAFGISFLIPDSLLWFTSLTGISHIGYSDIHMYLNHFGEYWGWIYSISLGAITAIVAWRTRSADFTYLASLAIPAVFLTAPIVEYYHLTMLILPYYYLFAALHKEKYCLIILSLSVFLIYYTLAGVHVTLSQYVGMYMLWIVAMIELKRAAHTANIYSS